LLDLIKNTELQGVFILVNSNAKKAFETGVLFTIWTCSIVTSSWFWKKLLQDHYNQNLICSIPTNVVIIILRT